MSYMVGKPKDKFSPIGALICRYQVVKVLITSQSIDMLIVNYKGF